MMGARIESTHKLTCPTSELTAGVISDFLMDIDSDAKVRVRVDNADRPGEISTVSLSADVDISKNRIY